jgi:hypothetical protein
VALVLLLIIGAYFAKEPTKQADSPKVDSAKVDAEKRPDRTAEVTWNYWQGLNKASHRAKKFEGVNTAAMTPEQISALFRDIAGTSRAMRTDVSGLSTRDVDPEAVGYGAETVEVFMLTEGLSSEFAVFIDEVKQFKTVAGSPATGVEAFVRGFLGDPLGKSNELSAQERQLEARRQKLLDRQVALHERAAKLEAREVTLRGFLSRKFGREFPKLD